MILLILIPFIYMLGMLGFYFWECYYGWGVDWDFLDGMAPSFGIACFFWWIAIPCCASMILVKKLEKIKTRRIEKEEQSQKMRIALQQEEEETILQQVEQELEQNRKSA